MNTYYYSDNHIFSSRSEVVNITLKAGKDETLTIESPTFTGNVVLNSLNLDSIGNTQVLYSSSGNVVGDQNLTYSNGALFSATSVSTGLINGSSSTNALLYNEIYRGTAPTNVVTTQTTNLDSLGTDVVMARNNNRVIWACPKTDDGGASVWLETSPSVFSEYTTNLITYSGITTGAGTKFVALNEDASILCLTNNDETTGKLTVWTRSGTNWTLSLSSFNGVNACRMSGNIVLYYDYESNFKVRTWSGSSWGSPTTLMSNLLPQNLNLDYPIFISSSKLGFYYNGNVYIYTLVLGIWTLSTTIAITAISMDYYNGVLAILSSSELKIYENEVLVQTISLANADKVCTNGTYIFASNTSDVIRIYHKIGVTWTQSTNTYTLSGAGKMSANADYLAVGAPGVGTYGTGYLFKIESYTNTPVTINYIDLLDSNNRIVVNAGGTNIMRFSSTGTSPLLQISGVVAKNYLYNGSFKVYQRNIIGRTTGATASSFLYTFDRWQLKTNANQASVVGSQSGAISGTFASRCQRNSGQTGTGTMVFGQALTIEMTTDLRGKFLTLSFYARKGANFSPTSNNITARIITGLGSTDRSNLQTGFVGADTVATTTVSLTDSFVRYSITTSATTATDITQLAVEFSWTPTGTASTNDWFEVSCVQLEANPFASDYYDIDYGTEVNRCSAFFQLITSLSAIATSTTAASMTTTLMCHMRSNPILSSLRQDGTPNTGLNISEGAFNYTQSSVSIVDFNSSRNGLAFNATNFTGLTTNRGYICYVAAGNYAGVACSCELT